VRPSWRTAAAPGPAAAQEAGAHRSPSPAAEAEAGAAMEQGSSRRPSRGAEPGRWDPGGGERLRLEHSAQRFYLPSKTAREAGGRVVPGRECSRLPIHPEPWTGPETPEPRAGPGSPCATDCPPARAGGGWARRVPSAWAALGGENLAAAGEHQFCDGRSGVGLTGAGRLPGCLGGGSEGNRAPAWEALVSSALTPVPGSRPVPAVLPRPCAQPPPSLAPRLGFWSPAAPFPRPQAGFLVPSRASARAHAFSGRAGSCRPRRDPGCTKSVRLISGTVFPPVLRAVAARCPSCHGRNVPGLGGCRVTPCRGCCRGTGRAVGVTRGPAPTLSGRKP